MGNKTTPIDWVEDVCMLYGFIDTLSGNKIYAVGGYLLQTSNTLSTSSVAGGETLSDSYLRIVDFSKPVDSSKNIIDIRTDDITTTIRLPDSIPRLYSGALFISDGVIHILPGRQSKYTIANADGNILDPAAYSNSTMFRTNPANKVWNFNLESNKWDLNVSGIEGCTQSVAVAFDAEKEVGWYYGGWYYEGCQIQNNSTNSKESMSPQALYRLDKGKDAPIKVETDSSSVGVVIDGELVYIKGIGRAGILVLLGGNDLIQARSSQIVHIFDIATSTWFTQITTSVGGMYPKGEAGFCSVVASAADNSSHNIYIYQGVDESTSSVFILTLPAFIWVQVYTLPLPVSEGDIDPTYRHRCQKVHEKHMVAYRGQSLSNTCDFDKSSGRFQGMAIYDMSALKWTTTIELENQQYLVPEPLYKTIGGNAMGNANTTGPRLGFQDPTLAQIFSTRTTPTNTSSSTPFNTTTPVTAPAIDDSQSKLPLGTIASIFVGSVVVLIAVLFLLRRRKRRRMAAHPQPVEVSANTELKEMQAFELHELHDPRNVSELPSSPPVELEGCVPETKLKD